MNKPIQLTVILILLGLLAACGGQPTVEEVAPAEESAAEAAAEGNAESTEAEQASGECEAGLRLVEHEFGTTCIPERPERVATNVETLVTNLLLLGIQPLTGPEDQAGWNAAYVSLFPDSVSIDDITDSGVTEQTNLETVLLADPEIIMTYEYTGEEFYDDFSGIAPTIVVERGENGDWRERFDREAAYLGREAEAGEIIAHYESALEELSNFTELTVAFIRRPNNGTFRMDAEGSFPGSVMEDAGLNYVTAPEDVGDFDGSSVSNISEERLDILMDADIIITPDWREAGFSDVLDLGGLQEFALWNTLPAVQAEQVLVVPGPVYNGGNYAAAQLLIEAIAEAVAELEPPAALAEAAAYPRTVTDATGREITFESRPERVVLDTNRYALDELLLLDVAPIGYQISASEELAPWTREAVVAAGFEMVNFNGLPYPNPPNFEYLVTLNPDLIIMLDYLGEGKAETLDHFDLYEQIAPVFVVEYTDPDASRIRMLAEVFAVEDKVAEIEARDAERFATVTPPPSGVELAVAFGYKDGGVAAQVYNGNGASELVILERAGFTIKDYGQPVGERDFYIGEENLTMLDADMLWNVAPYPGDRSAEDFESSTIMQNLTVVKEGHYRSLNSDQSQAILFWTPLATPFLVETLNELVASYDFEASTAPASEIASACDEGFRPFTHAAGETCIPENPQRIVTTQDQNALLPLLELGVKPVGSAGQLREDGSFQFRRVADFDTSDIEFIGEYGEPNLESIALLQPDLIIGPPFQADIYDDLSAIAPTVLIDVHERPLDEGLMDFATIVNATEQAEQFKAEYEANVAEFLEALGERREQLTVSIITPGYVSGQFYNEAGSQATGTVVQALDLLRPGPEQGPEPGREYRSLEVLSEHEADVMIIISYTGEEQDPLFDDFVNSPILNSLGVAQAEQIYIVDGLAVVGAGWSKMNTFIDELETILLEPTLDVDVVQE